MSKRDKILISETDNTDDAFEKIEGEAAYNNSYSNNYDEDDNIDLGINFKLYHSNVIKDNKYKKYNILTLHDKDEYRNYRIKNENTNREIIEKLKELYSEFDNMVNEIIEKHDGKNIIQINNENLRKIINQENANIMMNENNDNKTGEVILRASQIQNSAIANIYENVNPENIKERLNSINEEIKKYNKVKANFINEVKKKMEEFKLSHENNSTMDRKKIWLFKFFDFFIPQEGFGINYTELKALLYFLSNDLIDKNVDKKVFEYLYDKIRNTKYLLESINNSFQKLYITDVEDSDEVKNCIKNIILQYFSNIRQITYYDENKNEITIKNDHDYKYTEYIERYVNHFNYELYHFMNKNRHKKLVMIGNRAYDITFIELYNFFKIPDIVLSLQNKDLSITKIIDNKSFKLLHLSNQRITRRFTNLGKNIYDNFRPAKIFGGKTQKRKRKNNRL